MSSRFVYGVAAILAATIAYACFCRAPLIWDGAYQFNTSLIMQKPYFYLTRFHSYFLWLPVVYASRHTSNMMLLQTIYGLPFLLAPLAGLLLSWWIVRKHAPQLILWPIFGIAAGCLPGQIFVINDSIFQMHLFWPILMGVFVPLTIPRKIVLGILCVFQFVHPIGVALFFGAAMAACLVAIYDKAKHRKYIVRTIVLASIFMLALARIYVTNRVAGGKYFDSFAAEEAKWSVAVNRWRWGVKGWPLAGMCCMWAAAISIFLYRLILAKEKRRETLAVSTSQTSVGPSAVIPYVSAHLEYSDSIPPESSMHPLVHRLRSLDAQRVARFATGAGILGALFWLYWAHDGRLWWKAIDYRRWVGPLSAPFMILATLEACLAVRFRYVPTTPASPINYSERIGYLLAATFGLVFGLQCTIWRDLGNDLMAAVDNHPGIVVPEADVPWMAGTPMDHWASADYVVAREGKQPRKLLLDARSLENICAKPPLIPHHDFYPTPDDPTPSAAGWFDMRPLLKELAAHPPARPAHMDERLDIRSTPQ